MTDPWVTLLETDLTRQTRVRFKRAVEASVTSVKKDAATPVDTGQLRDEIVWDGVIDDDDGVMSATVTSEARSVEGFDYPRRLNSTSTWRASGRRNPHHKWWNRVWSRSGVWGRALERAFNR